MPNPSASTPIPEAGTFHLRRLLDDLERLSGYRITFHNVGQMPRVSPLGAGETPHPREPAGSHGGSFCKALKETPAGSKGCVACDVGTLNRRWAQSLAPFRWRCYAGLEEVLVPVVMDGRHVGTFFGGQARPEKLSARERARLRRRWHGLGLDPRRMERLLQASPAAEPERLAALARVLAALAERVAARAAAAAIARALETEKRTPVERVLALMLERLDRPLSLEELAREVHLSPSRLSHLFTQAEGESFRDRLLRLRMERARELLAMTLLPVHEVAQRVGYADPNFFSRFFREKAGESPRAYRVRNARA